MRNDTLSISWTLNDDVRNIIERILVTAENKNQSSGSYSRLCMVAPGNATAQCDGLTPGCSYKVTVAVAVGEMKWSNSVTTNIGKCCYLVFQVIVCFFRIL